MTVVFIPQPLFLGSNVCFRICHQNSTVLQSPQVPNVQKYYIKKGKKVYNWIFLNIFSTCGDVYPSSISCSGMVHMRKWLATNKISWGHLIWNTMSSNSTLAKDDLGTRAAKECCGGREWKASFA